MGRETQPEDDVVHHLEMAILAARGAGSPAFFAHVEKARALHHAHGSASGVQSGTLTPWQRQRAEELLVASLEGAVSLDDVAAECGLSRLQFARAFAKTIGMPPRDWVRTRRLESAKRLLVETDRTLAEIAAATGFADPSHLARVFKAATGTTPTAYRRSPR